VPEKRYCVNIIYRFNVNINYMILRL